MVSFRVVVGSLAVGISCVSAESIRSAYTEEEQLVKILKAMDDGKTDLPLEELGIEDVREAQNLCNSLLNLGTIFPEFMTCSCAIRPLALRIDFSCTMEFCLGQGGTGGLFSQTCVLPSYEGTYSLLGSPKSKICNEPMVLNFNILGQPQAINLPKICVLADHQRNFIRISKCQFLVGTEECTCTVCSSGTDISIDCTKTTALGVLTPLAKFECIGISLIQGRQEQVDPFVNPILLLASEMSD